MRNTRSVIAACALAVAAGTAPAAPGDVVVPAHRTKDGQWVPANVPPTSGKTHLARRPTRAAATTKQPASAQDPASTRSAPLMPPLLVEAQPIRR